MSICGTPFVNQLPTKESVFRTELAKLALPDRIRRIDYQLAANRVALAARNERLLALRGDFDVLTMDFWNAFGRSLGCEDPAETIAYEQARLRSVGYLGIVFCALTLTIWVVAVLQASGAIGLAVCVGAIGLIGSCFFIAAPFRQLGRSRNVSAILLLRRPKRSGGRTGPYRLGLRAPHRDAIQLRRIHVQTCVGRSGAGCR